MAMRFKGQGYWSIADMKVKCDCCKKDFYANSSWVYIIDTDPKVWFCSYSCSREGKAKRSRIRSDQTFKPIVFGG